MADHHHGQPPDGDGRQAGLGVGSAGGGDLEIKEQDRLLPIANVGRIMKQILPPNAKISKEAKETMQECVSEFISFVTGEASDKCHKEKRKTVNGDDVCWAFGALGFDDYVDPMRRYLHKYRELEETAPPQPHPPAGAVLDPADPDPEETTTLVPPRPPPVPAPQPVISCSAPPWTGPTTTPPPGPFNPSIFSPSPACYSSEQQQKLRA